MHTQTPVLGYAPSQDKVRLRRNQRKIIVALLAAFFLIFGYQLAKKWRIELRHRHQTAVLKAILAEKGGRFRKVQVICIETMPEVILVGEVQSDADMDELHREMAKRLGNEVGRTAILNVWCPSSGNIWEGDKEKIRPK